MTRAEAARINGRKGGRPAHAAARLQLAALAYADAVEAEDELPLGHRPAVAHRKRKWDQLRKAATAFRETRRRARDERP